MPYVVTQSCCADASCVLACPVNCIHPAPGEAGFAEAQMLYVDPATCVGCGACATACPVDAIVAAGRLGESQQPFVDLNAEYYQAFPHADRTPVARVPHQRRLLRPEPVRVAVIGAGPAGLYTADELLKHPEVTVDVYDRLRTPYGLVRHGVAPDHSSTKQVTRLFAAIEQQPGFRYCLGVEVGKDLSIAELRRRYTAVVMAVGAASDRPLRIPGERLFGSVPATALVGWYNGHPDQRALPVPLTAARNPSGRAVVIGNGNVALDVARILTADPDALARTDLAPHALDQLRASDLREVVILGRRGPAQAAFTVPELIGLTGLTGVDVVVEADPAQLVGTGTAGRLLAQLATRSVDPAATRRRIVLRFSTSPAQLLGTSAVTGVRVVRNRLEIDANGVSRAVPTEQIEDIPAGLVIRAAGFRGLPVPGLPYDEATGTIPHQGGRVEPGIYAAGWIKRGPSGFIGTNKSCAAETVSTILDDLDAGLAPPEQEASTIPALLRKRGIEAIDRAAWARLDAAELALGEQQGRPRIKLTDPAQQAQAAQPVGWRRSLPVLRSAR